ncbi:MAG: AAA family ATPase [Candidatus Hodarchaeales archaeon]|jgi:hypothetical protein
MTLTEILALDLRTLKTFINQSFSKKERLNFSYSSSGFPKYSANWNKKHCLQFLEAVGEQGVIDCYTEWIEKAEQEKTEQEKQKQEKAEQEKVEQEKVIHISVGVEITFTEAERKILDSWKEETEGYLKRDIDSIVEQFCRRYERPKIYFSGTAGTGKTEAGKHLGVLREMPSGLFSCSEQTTLKEFFCRKELVSGSTMGVTNSMGDLIEKPSTIVIDEFNNLLDKQQISFLECLQNGYHYIPDIDRTFVRHPLNTIVLTGNPRDAKSRGNEHIIQPLLDRLDICYTMPDFTASEISEITGLQEFEAEYFTSLRDEFGRTAKDVTISLRSAIHYLRHKQLFGTETAVKLFAEKMRLMDDTCYETCLTLAQEKLIAGGDPVTVYVIAIKGKRAGLKTLCEYFPEIHKSIWKEQIDLLADNNIPQIDIYVDQVLTSEQWGNLKQMELENTITLNEWDYTNN